MWTNRIRLAALPSLLFLLLLLSCGTNHGKQVEVEGMEEFREGDLVLRCGRGAESRAVTAASSAPFSHIGILHFDSLSAEWIVIHAVPGENVEGEPELIKKECIDAFFRPDRAKSGGWLRIQCSNEAAAQAARYALLKEQQRVAFDNDYSLEDTVQLYCTELVWRAYGSQDIDISSGSRSEAPRVFCSDGACIFPSDIVNSETTLFIKHFKTKDL